MRRIRVITVAFLLSVLFLFFSTACDPVSSEPSLDFNEGYQYVMILTKLTSSFSSNSDYIWRVSASKDHIYALMYYDLQEVEPGGFLPTSYGFEVYDKHLNLVKTIDYVPYDENFRLNQICVARDEGFWTIEEAEISAGESIFDTRLTLLRYFNADGEAQISIDVSAEFGIRFYGLGATDGQGRIYIYYGDAMMTPPTKIALIDKNGELIAKWEDSFSEHIQIAVLGNNRTIVCQFGRSDKQLFELVDDGKVEHITQFSVGNLMLAGAGNYIYIIGGSGGSDLYKLSLDTLDIEHLTNYSDAVRGGEFVQTLMEFPGDILYGFINGRIYSFEKSSSQNNTERHWDEAEDNRQVINVAMYGTNMAFSIAISNFNATNDEYRMVITDYSRYATDTDPYGGIVQLNHEIIAGKVPDLFLFGMLSTSSGFDTTGYADKGIFANMYDLLDNDPEYSKESFIPNILQSLEYSDGNLYELPFDFVVSVVACSRSDIALEKWNFDEFYAELEKRKDAEFIYGMATKEIILFLTLINNWDEFIDWRTRECNFTNESFIRLLEFCKYHVGDEEDMVTYTLPNQAIADGKQYLVYNTLSTVSSIQKFKAMFQNEVTFIGFPTNDGRGNSIRLVSSASIYENSPYIDICWEFVRQFIDKDYQLKNFDMFPTNIDAIEARLTHPEEYEESGSGIQYVGQHGDVLTVIFTDATNEESAQVRELIFSIDRVQRHNEPLMNIIFGDAVSYFNGYRTAEETARIIQSKVTIYLNE